MDEGAWWAAVHGVARSRTQLSDFTFTFQFHALEKKILWYPLQYSCLENPRDGGAWWLPSLGSHSRTRLKQLSKGTFHAKMGTIKDRNSIYLTEAEGIKKRWQEYTEDLYKKRS